MSQGTQVPNSGRSGSSNNNTQYAHLDEAVPVAALCSLALEEVAELQIKNMDVMNKSAVASTNASLAAIDDSATAAIAQGADQATSITQEANAQEAQAFASGAQAGIMAAGAAGSIYKSRFHSNLGELSSEATKMPTVATGAGAGNLAPERPLEAAMKAYRERLKVKGTGLSDDELSSIIKGGGLDAPVGNVGGQSFSLRDVINSHTDPNELLQIRNGLAKAHANAVESYNQLQQTYSTFQTFGSNTAQAVSAGITSQYKTAEANAAAQQGLDTAVKSYADQRVQLTAQAAKAAEDLFNSRYQALQGASKAQADMVQSSQLRG